MSNSYGTATYTCNPWIPRIHNSTKAFEAWENKFHCARLEDYYENFQWKNKTDSAQLSYRPYTLNLFHSTIKIKLASFLFQRPEFTVSPEPGHSHWDLDFAYQSAQLKQDVLNTIVKNRNVKFAKHLKLAALDSFFRFGMIEVGYAADWRNPIKEDPYLKSWDNPDINEDADRVKNQNEVPVNERFFIKRIKPSRFRTSVSDAEDLEDHEWVGYWQYYYTSTLRHTPGIKFPKNYNGSSHSLDHTGSYSKDLSTGLYLNNTNNNTLCKVWHIWDLVSKKRKLILDDYDEEDFLLWSQDFERLPLTDLRWDLRLNGFLPIPPAWYWLSAQDEINESREQIRSYRRRFTRKFQYVKGKIDPEEVEKFVSGPDGIVVEVKERDAISAIDNPEIGPTSERALIQAKDDFLIASGSSAENQGANADRQTATAAKITDVRAQVRENVEQLDFQNFACEIGQEILCQAQEKLVEGLWVKYSSNPSEGVLQDMQVNQPIFKYIKAEDLSDGYDFNVRVDIRNATPAAMEQAKNSFMNFVAFLQTYPMVAMSPLLIREAAYRFGYTDEAVIHQMQQVAALAMAAKAHEAAGQQGMTLGQASANANGGGGMNPADTARAQMESPDVNQIQNQITEQIQ